MGCDARKEIAKTLTDEMARRSGRSAAESRNLAAEACGHPRRCSPAARGSGFRSAAPERRGWSVQDFSGWTLSAVRHTPILRRSGRSAAESRNLAIGSRRAHRRCSPAARGSGFRSAAPERRGGLFRTFRVGPSPLRVTVRSMLLRRFGRSAAESRNLAAEPGELKETESFTGSQSGRLASPGCRRQRSRTGPPGGASCPVNHQMPVLCDAHSCYLNEHRAAFKFRSALCLAG